MPRKCIVFACTKQHTSSFALPNDERLKKLWLNAIPKFKTNITTGRVCVQHFKNEDLRWTSTKDGKTIKFKRPLLKPNAIPSIFHMPRRVLKRNYISSFSNVSKSVLRKKSIPSVSNSSESGQICKKADRDTMTLKYEGKYNVH